MVTLKKTTTFFTLLLIFLLFPGKILAQQIKTFSPVEIPISEDEIINPFRGLYKWRGVETVKLPEPALDAYERYNWRDLEPTRNNYNFSKIDEDIAQAAAEGRKFAFRIRSMVGYGDGKLYVPDYMEPYGFWLNNTFIPDWNSTQYIDSVSRLMAALGAKYNSDTRISWIDIGMFGQFGEWALDNAYRDPPGSMTPVTDDSLRAIVDAHATAFPDKQLVSIATPTYFAGRSHAFSLNLKFPVGWRSDCLGKSGYMNQWYDRPEMWNTFKDRWKMAPVVGEYCAGADASIGLEDVKDLHVSLISNGNMGTNPSNAVKDLMLQAGKAAGYRLILRNATLPNPIVINQNSNWITKWSNIGNAPVYADWDVRLQLRDIVTKEVVWQQISTLNLKNLLPTINNNIDFPVTVTDIFNVTGIVPGVYEFHVKITDRYWDRRPIQLSIEGLQPNESYYLGNINVLASATNPDANNDGRIDGVDFVIWLQNFGKTNSAGPSEGDFDFDFLTNLRDYAIWLMRL